MSSGVKDLADDSNQPGDDIRWGFPEFFGMAKILQKLREEKQDNSELKGWPVPTIRSNLYMLIYMRSPIPMMIYLLTD